MSVEIGSYLRQARESAGLSLEEVQEKTRIQKSFLIAIENGEFDKLPSPFYVRTYLRSYANCVKVEPHHILRYYRKEEQAQRFGHHRNGSVSQNTLLSNTMIRSTSPNIHGMPSFAEHLQKTMAHKAVQEQAQQVSTPKSRTSLSTALTIAKPTTAGVSSRLSSQGTMRIPNLSTAQASSRNTERNPAKPGNTGNKASFSNTLIAKTNPFSNQANQTSKLSEQTKKLTAATNMTKVSQSTNPGLRSSKLPTISKPKQSNTGPISRNTDTKKLPELPFAKDRLGTERLGTNRFQTIYQENQVDSSDFLQKTNTNLSEDVNASLLRNSRFQTSKQSLTSSGRFSTSSVSPSLRERRSAENRDLAKTNPGSRVSQDVSLIPAATRSSTARHLEEERRRIKKEAPIYQKRWFQGALAGVIVIPLLGYFIFAGGTEEKKTNPDTTQEVPLQLDQSPSTNNNTEQQQDSNTQPTSSGISNGDGPGRYILSGTDKVELVISPNGDACNVILTVNNKKEDFTIKKGDKVEKRSYTLGEKEVLIINLGAPENVNVTANGKTVTPGKGNTLIKIQKK